MIRRMAAICVLSTAALPAVCHAASMERPAPASKSHRSTLDFRLIDEPRYSTKPIRDAGMIAQTGIAPGAAIGIGLFKSSQRKLDAGEWKTDARATGSRKAAVRFLFKF